MHGETLKLIHKYSIISLYTTIYLSYKLSYSSRLLYSHHQADYKSKQLHGFEI